MPSVNKAVCYILSLVSFHFVSGKLYSTSTSDVKTCVAEDDACLEVNHFTDTEEIDGPTFIGRDGLTRLDGVRAGHEEEVNLGDCTRKRITRAMKPLLFEIPHFLTNEECDYIIWRAEEKGLISSIARGGLTKREDLEIPEVESGKGEAAAGIFEAWDVNHDGEITVQEVIDFAKRYMYVVFSEEDLMDLLHKVNVTELDDGTITFDEFQTMNTRGADTVMYHASKTHPKYRPRYSDQTWINQRALRDPVLDKLLERVIKLTKLPREIVYGSERLQVVYYDKNGHYNAHFDSETHKMSHIPCCHQMEEKKMLNFEVACRLCRYITILYYLNDVEEGGETAFPVADNKTLDMEYLKDNRVDKDYFNLSHNCNLGNLIIKPRKGTAIMWYNHFMDKKSGWLGEMDEYSLHGGCDILKGEKWIANNWITAPYENSADIKSTWLSFYV
ncbi:transmembrane prolyl 4-hydroxylase-like [Acropora palmata]|uniref:transmembrane prolyl 4-hydroxylase-like n=1 Tax=Acropora palmata TaxID=6131 RepID=UPI003DA11338